MAKPPEKDVPETGREAIEAPLSDEDKDRRITEYLNKLAEIHQQEMKLLEALANLFKQNKSNGRE
jgi:hypothetical protein